jgi:hypothetical protein
MNDTKLADAVKSGLTEACDTLNTVHLAIPASEIMARADKARRRRRVGVLAGVGGLAAAAVAVSVALPVSHPARVLPADHPASGPATQLAAWTVTRQADGNIQVTFREMRDAAGLQRVLRADGVPVSVTFPGPENPACRNWPSPHWRLGQGPVYFGPHNGTPPPYALVIRPAVLPSGVGLALFGFGGTGPGVNLVRASPRCTGN